MKKKLLKAFFGLFVLTFLLGCGKEIDEQHAQEKLNMSNEVSLTIKEGTLSNTGASFILKNASIYDFSYGNPFRLETFLNSKWVNVEPIEDLNFTLPAYALKANESVTLKIDWQYGYGSLSSGKYRLVKEVTREFEDDSREMYYVAAEFTIK